jgi:outer membrane autotransporter protein
LGQLVATRLRGLFDTVPPAANPVLNYGSQGPEVAFPDFAPAEPEATAWGVTYGSRGEVSSDGNAAAFSTGMAGLAGGIDNRVGDWQIGVVAGYSQTHFAADGVGSSGESGNYSAGLYAGTHWDALSFRSGLALTHHEIETTRNVAFDGFSDTLAAEYGARTLQAFGELGYRLALGDGEMEVFGNLSHLWLATDGYEESGGDAALSADASEQHATFTTLGLRASQPVAIGEMTGTVHGLVGWLHGHGGLASEASHAIGSGGEFLVRGASMTGDSVQVQAGLDIDLSKAITLGLGYEGVWSADAIQNGARLGLNAKF